MLESECKNVENNIKENTKVDITKSVYVCVSENAKNILDECITSIQVKNSYHYL